MKGYIRQGQALAQKEPDEPWEDAFSVNLRTLHSAW